MALIDSATVIKQGKVISNLKTADTNERELVHKGEILGIAGVEGNGQSELIKVLTGLMTCTGLCRNMTISENCIAGYFCNHEVCKKGVLDSRRIKQLTENYIGKYDIRLSDVCGQISQLSGGNAQKVIIAREFENGPQLIIVCQPTRGAVCRKQVRN